MAEMASTQLTNLRAMNLDASVESLLRIYSKDPELLFILGTETVSSSAESPLPELSALAHQLSTMIANGYEISLTSTHSLLSGAGHTISFKRESADEVRSFLAAVSGFRQGMAGGKDYRGRHASAAEIMFLLGDRETWSADELRLQATMADAPDVLRLADEEHIALQTGTPAYCLHALRKCATRVVQAPSAVFRGLRREGKLTEGIAYCGHPKRAYSNDGSPLKQPLDGFIFVVYADPEGFVFDWDWVPADQNDPSVPENASQRFTSRVKQQTAILVGIEDLTIGEFKANAWYSTRGDCIFYYISDSPSYASRVNDELTVFMSFANSDQMTGCKVKKVSRIWRDVKKSDRLREGPHANIPLVTVLANSFAIQALNGHAPHYIELMKHADASNAEVQIENAAETLTLPAN